MQFAEVVFDRPMRQSYHYSIPEHLQQLVKAGHRVRVSFGRQKNTVGYVVRLVDTIDYPPEKIKSIENILEEDPLISEVILRLSEQVAMHYCCSWGEVLHAALPRGVRENTRQKTIRTVNLACTETEVQNWLKEHRTGKYEKRVRVLRVMLEEVEGDITPFELSAICGVSRNLISSMAKDGLLKLIDRLVDDDPFQMSEVSREDPLELNDEQEQALEPILGTVGRREFGVFLVQGVTGSGKTEIYLQAIDQVVKNGDQAIVLVPEISLTPQTVRRFSARFERLAVLHSRQTESQRGEQWRRIQQGDVQVIIGARSAIFAPARSLGLIVVDEEHENSFKQDNSPRYNARDVAVIRANLESSVVLLGSATPSLESYQNWKSGKYQRVVLKARVENRPMPSVEIIDMNQELAGAKYWNFLSLRLRFHMEEILQKDEQALLFLNRRGFSTHVQCFRCGFSLQCTDCASAMTYYQRRNLAICLLCRKEIEPPELCPECRVGKLRYLGIGTEKVEEEVKKIFPNHPVARMDSDTMRGRGAVEKRFTDFREGRIRVLVGTQMISKGLDLPNVTLVGVISADTSFNLPDFRAFERTFQAVAQVAGRAGRGSKPGHVIVQTFVPKHYSITMASEHDFESFARRELHDRETLDYPPFTRAMRILFTGPNEKEVENISMEKVQWLRGVAPETVQFLGPAPCVIPYVRKQFRWHCMLYAPQVGMIRYLADCLDSSLKRSGKTQIVIDVDPVSVF